MKKVNGRLSSSIVSVCLFSMVSSAMLPHTAMAQNSPNVQRPLNFNQALRAYGIDKQSADFSFTSKQIDRNQAVFRGVKLGSDSTVDVLTVTILPNGQDIQFRAENWNLHEKEYSLKMQNGIIIDRSMQKGIQPKIMDLFGPETKSSQDFFGDIIGEKIEIQNKTDTSSPFVFDKIAVLGFLSSKDKFRFDSIEIDGFRTQVSSFDFAFNSFKLAGLSDAIFQEMNKTDAAKKSAKNNLTSALSVWDKIGLELLHLGGFKVTLATNSTSRPRAGLENVFGGFELGSFDLRNITPKNWGHFSLKGIKAKATMSNEDVNFKLNEISFGGLDLGYFKAIYGSLLDKESAAQYENLTLADLFKGGPMDSGLEAAAFKGLEIAGMGGEITLDDASFNVQKNANGIYTKLTVPRGKFEIKSTDEKKPFGAILSGFNDRMGLESFRASWGGNSEYEVASDTATSYFDFKIDNFGAFDFRAKADGMSNWHKQTKVKDMIKAMMLGQEMGKPEATATESVPAPANNQKPAATPEEAAARAAAAAAQAAAEAATSNQNKPVASASAANTNQPQTKGPAKSFDKLAQVYKEMWPLYKGVRLISANLEIRDLGALNKIAVNEAATKGKTPTQIRQEWRAPLGQYIATKSNPAIFRQLALGFSSFLSKGGSFKITLEPPTPFDISRFGETDLNTNDLGMKSTVSQ